MGRVSRRDGRLVSFLGKEQYFYCDPGTTLEDAHAFLMRVVGNLPHQAPKLECAYTISERISECPAPDVVRMACYPPCSAQLSYQLIWLLKCVAEIEGAGKFTRGLGDTRGIYRYERRPRCVHVANMEKSYPSSEIREARREPLACGSRWLAQFSQFET